MEKKEKTKPCYLTHQERWFIRLAINMQEAVLPLDDECLSTKTFKEDYGWTKQEVRQMLKKLETKLKEA